MPLSKIQFGNTGSSRKNIIINGGMQVSQRSTSAETSVNQEYKTVDRVKSAFITTGTVTTQQVTDVPAGEGFSHSMKTTVTGADTSVAAGDFIDLYQQRIEARNISTLMYGTSGAKTTTLSFYVKSNVTGVYNGTISNQNDSVKLPFSFSISSANTWERIIIDNIPPITTGSDSGTAWETSTYTNMGAAVRIFGTLGSNYYGATNKVWNTAGTATSYGHQAQVNFLSSISNNFFITGVQWEEGTNATEFEHRFFDEELLLCQRYFQLISGGNFPAASATTLEGSVTRREMRAAPTIGATAVLKAEDPSVTVYTQSSAVVTTVQADAFSEKMQLKNFSGLSTQRPYFLRNPAAGSGHVTLEAEL